MELVYKNEKTLFPLMVAFSALAWLVLVVATMGVALIYLLFFFVFYCFAQSALISHIKGTAVHITEQQFPDLKQRIAACCRKLDIDEEPQAYIMHMGGMFNAFATRFFGRNFIVLYSDIVDALEDDPDALNFYIGHELGHIKRNHLRWSAFLLPASVLPLIGAAYSRAREYTSDRHGLAACEQPASAQNGLAALAAGGKRWRTMNHGGYVAQGEHSGGFWMSLHELMGDYPWLVKRMGAVHALAKGEQVEQPRRNPFAVFLALFIPRVGGGGAGAIVTVATIGVLAAVAIPAYQQYTQKVKAVEAVQHGKRATAAVEAYYVAHQAPPSTLEQAGVNATPGGAVVERITLDAQNGVVKVHAKISGHGADVISFSAQRAEGGGIVWVCNGGALNAEVLPADCR